jgi:hypothetical protein
VRSGCANACFGNNLASISLYPFVSYDINLPKGSETSFRERGWGNEYLAQSSSSQGIDGFMLCLRKWQRTAYDDGGGEEEEEGEEDER